MAFNRKPKMPRDSSTPKMIAKPTIQTTCKGKSPGRVWLLASARKNEYSLALTPSSQDSGFGGNGLGADGLLLLTSSVNPYTSVFDPRVTMKDGTRTTVTKNALKKPTAIATTNASINPR